MGDAKSQPAPSMDQGMMTMMPVNEIAVPVNGSATLAPNGLHMMMFGLKSKLAVGDKVPVTLKLDNGDQVQVTATVRQ